MIPEFSLPKIFGILNLSLDSFSDGGLFCKPELALEQARHLRREGAFAIDIGAVSSNPDANPVPPETELRRILEVVHPLSREGFVLSIDSFQTDVQRALLQKKSLWIGSKSAFSPKTTKPKSPGQEKYNKPQEGRTPPQLAASKSGGIACLNDIQGFCDDSLYPLLQESDCRLVLMHSIQDRGIATKERWTGKGSIVEHILGFFEARLAALTGAGISESRIILDPGMGFFLGSDPAHSFEVLAGVPRFKRALGLELLLSVSRKSFLGAATGRQVQRRAFATLGAELLAALLGVDYIRTHDPGALRDALLVWQSAAACR